jgi:carboxyl-terminal processing protease
LEWIQAKSSRRHWQAAWLCLAILPALAGATPENDVETLRHKALQCEEANQWVKACALYEQVLARDRGQLDVRERYQICLRHLQLARRCQDGAFRAQVQSQDFSFTLKVYAEVVAKLRANFVDGQKADPAALFRYGIDELRLALADRSFRQQYLPAATAQSIHDFQAQLGGRWNSVAIENPNDARVRVTEVALAAQAALGIQPAVTVLEFACGACNGLDEYTVLLTPGELIDECTALDGVGAGVGIDVALINHDLAITQVWPGSAAAIAGLKAGDIIRAIDKTAADKLSAEAAAARLKGPAGSRVELEVLALGEPESHLCELMRQTLAVPSVLQVRLLKDQPAIGYCQLAAFQKATVQELDNALVQLRSQGMKGLILDLRGNPGGLFQSAIHVTERFIAEGIIVTTQSRVRDHNRTYRANNNTALALPLVVLIDGDTASAAEIVAGALKDHDRAMLIGQPTFGKGCIQGVLQLETVASGIRVTLARFFSPRGQAYSGNGVTPHILIEQSPATMSDSQLEVALQQVIRLISPAP